MKYFYQLLALRTKAADGRTTTKSLARSVKEYVSLFETQADFAQEINEYEDRYYEWGISYNLLAHLAFAALTLPEAKHELPLMKGPGDRVLSTFTFPKLAQAYITSNENHPNVLARIREIESQYKGVN